MSDRPIRKPLPNRRKGYNQKVSINGQVFYLRTDEYQDGRLGRIRIDAAKYGTTLRGLLESFAQSVSIGLQCGIPLDVFAAEFTDTSFPPDGFVEGDPDVEKCKSILDYIFRHLAANYPKKPPEVLP